MPGLTCQKSTTTNTFDNTDNEWPTLPQKPLLLPDELIHLAIAKEECGRLKKEWGKRVSAKAKDNDFATKHSAVIKFIKLKHIAIQWINNTYRKIGIREERILKKEAREQCISRNLTPDPFLVQNPAKEPPFLWKQEFVIYANGEWFPHEKPVSPPTSPQKNKQGKVLSFGDEIEVAEGSERLQVKKGVPMSQFDGPLLTKEKAFADMIELWFNLKYTSGRKVYTGFWTEPKIKLFKKMGLFNSFGDMMEDSLFRYSEGENISFLSSKGPFKMDSTLEEHMDIMFNQYKKHQSSQGLNTNAKLFVPSFH